MDGFTLKEVLKVDFLSFTKEEVESIMEEELEKAPEEMDTELIDMCIEILTGETEKKAEDELTAPPAVSERKVRKIKFKKGLLVAAIITLLMSIAIPVGANIFNIDASEKILQVYEDYFSLDLTGENSGKTLSDILAENQIENVVLPEFLYTDCEITEFKTNTQENSVITEFKFCDSTKNIFGSVGQVAYSFEYDFFVGKGRFDKSYPQVKELNVNGINILVFSEEEKSVLIYYTLNSEYIINLEGDITFEKAIEIAETLK